jgi:hypothetical protein
MVMYKYGYGVELRRSRVRRFNNHPGVPGEAMGASGAGKPIAGMAARGRVGVCVPFCSMDDSACVL